VPATNIANETTPLNLPPAIPYAATLGGDRWVTLAMLWGNNATRPSIDYVATELKSLGLDVLKLVEKQNALVFEIRPHEQLLAAHVYEKCWGLKAATVLRNGSMTYYPNAFKGAASNIQDLVQTIGEQAAAAADAAEWITKYWWVPVLVIALLLVAYVVWQLIAVYRGRRRKR